MINTNTNFNILCIALLIITGAHGLLASHRAEDLVSNGDIQNGSAVHADLPQDHREQDDLNTSLLTILTVSNRNQFSADDIARMVKKLLDAKADPNAVRTGWSSALINACCQGHSIVVKLLIDHKADVRYAMEGHTALHSAAFSITGHPGRECGRMVELLLDAGADPDGKRHSPYETPFQSALKSSNSEVVRIFLERGIAHPNALISEPGFEGSPLELARNRRASEQCITTLLAAGAGPEELEELTEAQLKLVENVNAFKKSIRKQDGLNYLKNGEDILREVIPVDSLVTLIGEYYGIAALDPLAEPFRQRLIEQVAEESQPKKAQPQIEKYLLQADETYFESR